MKTDVIAAYSGGSLPAAIGIIRLSGTGAIDILSSFFKPKGKKRITDCKTKEMIYGELLASDGQPVDICLICIYRGPNSYTGEDMAEVFCHGSQAIVSAALRSAFVFGARPAEAGEFTKRAFMNGKMDLSEAEAVADLIYSQTEQGAKNAAALLKGCHSTSLKEMREGILGLIAHFYAVCDYSDEDIEPFEYENAVKIISGYCLRLENLYNGYLRSSSLSDGIPVAIIGKPNAGKSSIFNCLVGFERAIVTEEAGTTRDVVGHRITLGGKTFSMMDTAGIRNGLSKAETIGIERSFEAARDAMLIITVFDGSAPLEEEDIRVVELAKGKNAAAVINKTDKLNLAFDEDLILGSFESVFQMSAITGEGIEGITAWMEANAPDMTEAIITSPRQAGLILEALRALQEAKRSAQLGLTADAFLLDAERAARLIGQILGYEVDIDITEGIFSRFCVGK
ncbi:MAG: tRNA uridine-5-carboxymethylaminomethyl(34) synthesis GTPase MnmE [Clostridiaceae bacterium]|nr:tRNA uridine-5-carboxymethylaminomethyl(34) synthesis GTPase MnmE [Clostridiaceae bacterium]